MESEENVNVGASFVNTGSDGNFNVTTDRILHGQNDANKTSSDNDSHVTSQENDSNIGLQDNDTLAHDSQTTGTGETSSLPRDNDITGETSSLLRDNEDIAGETSSLPLDNDDMSDDDGSDMDDQDIDTTGTSHSKTQDEGCPIENERSTGIKTTLNRCFEELKDLAELSFNENINKDGVVEFKKKKKKKVTCAYLKLKKVLIGFRKSLYRVISRCYFTRPRERRPPPVFVSEDMLIHCIRETWLNPDIVTKVNFIETIHSKKFSEAVGNIEGTDLHFCKVVFRNNLLHSAVPVRNPMKALKL